MSRGALPGEHYCENHQGNHSHYAKENCTVCKLEQDHIRRGRLLQICQEVKAELEAENKALREALEAMVEMVEMGGFGKAYAMDLAKAALQGQGE